MLVAALALALLVAFASAGRWESRRNAHIQNERMAAVFAKATSDGLISRRLWRYRLAAAFDCLSYKPVGEPRATNGLELCFWPDGRLVETIDRSSGTPHFASLLEHPALSTLRIPMPRLLRVFATAGAFKDPRWAGLSPRHLSRLPVGFADIGAFHYYPPKKKK